MKPFSKTETVWLVVIFTVLVTISIPNFIVSIKRAKDQMRRDAMGALSTALSGYHADFEAFPLASPDGRIMDCEKPGDKPFLDKNKKWIFNFVPCDWGRDSFSNLITGNPYISILPADSDYQKGVKYLYFSDGNRYQIYAAMEVADEAEIDPKIIARKLDCGGRTCNIGRSVNVPIDISIEEYDKLILDQNAKTKK